MVLLLSIVLKFECLALMSPVSLRTTLGAFNCTMQGRECNTEKTVGRKLLRVLCYRQRQNAC